MEVPSWLVIALIAVFAGLFAGGLFAGWWWANQSKHRSFYIDPVAGSVDRLQDIANGIGNLAQEHLDQIAKLKSETLKEVHSNKQQFVQVLDDVLAQLRRMGEDLERQFTEVRESLQRPPSAESPQQTSSDDAKQGAAKSAQPRGRERRVSVRFPFEYTQGIAPFDDAPLETKRFELIKCHDLSATGFSYWSETEPPFKQALVRFGEPPHSILMVAEIMHSTHKRLGAGREYLVGCRFITRLDKDARKKKGQRTNGEPVFPWEEAPCAS